MSCATSPGWETIATWLEGISTVVAPMRLANMRSASGGSAWSSTATRYQDGGVFHAGTPTRSPGGGGAGSSTAPRYQDGSVFQAGTPITSPKAEVARGCWTAYITFALTVSTSAAEWLTKSSSRSQPKPCWSVNICASAGVTGPWDSSAPSDSPWSRPNAAM